MDTKNYGFDWEAILGLLIIGGFFGLGNGGFGFGSNARNDITNEFLYNQMANDIRANGQAIATTDRDVLTTSCNTDKEVLNNRFENQLAFANSNSMMQSCCCEIKGLVRDEVQSLKDLINSNTIQELRDTKQGYELVSALSNQSNLLSSRFGSWYLNTPVNPYYAYANQNPYYYGTTIQ